MTEIRSSMPALRGVVHAAGVLDDGVIPHQTWARFRTVLAPKVAGSWNLHRATADEDLDLHDFGKFLHRGGNVAFPRMLHLRQLGKPEHTFETLADGSIGKKL